MKFTSQQITLIIIGVIVVGIVIAYNLTRQNSRLALFQQANTFQPQSNYEKCIMNCMEGLTNIAKERVKNDPKLASSYDLIDCKANNLKDMLDNFEKYYIEYISQSGKIKTQKDFLTLPVTEQTKRYCVGLVATCRDSLCKPYLK